jgi:cytochrome c biogenesis protein CcmG/thiol:disulfide interchange protein DsbE
MLQGAPVGTLGENDAMGTLTPPPGPTAHPAPPSRFDAGRPAPPVGPSGRAILFGLFAVVAAAWLLMRAPTKLAAGSLPRLAADGTPAGDAPAGRCGGAKGCLIVYVAPWCGPCKASLPGDRALADFVKDRGIETTFVVGMDAMPRCAEMARTIGREVLVDASGAWARKMSIRGVPHFLVTGPDGRVKKRQAGALLASPDVVARHLGL